MKSPLGWILLGCLSSSGHAAPALAPPIDSQIVFLYYADVDTASRFYGEVLGLEKTFDEGWVRIFRSGATSFVGVVDETQGAHRAATARPVMVSMVTKDVDQWYTHLREAGVPIRSELSQSSRVPVRAFVVEDPGGYTVEFFEWVR